MLNDGRNESPWIPAGLFSSVSMIIAIVIREVVMRNRRASIYAAQRRLDSSVLSVPFPAARISDPEKLTLERNNLLIDEIVRKSEAAKVLSRLGESHREVFQLCDAYIETVRRELPHIGVGSPRLAAVRRGRDKAERIHKFHMLKWAEIEAKSNAQAASIAERIDIKLKKAKKALSVVEIASSRYPEDRNLADSRFVLEELVESIKASRKADAVSKTKVDIESIENPNESK